MANLSNLSLCTYNCRSLKSSLYDVQRLCANYDIIFLQEHWLLPFELNTLSNINTEFLAFGVSAVDISSDVLRGRPYGGTAVLYRKQFAPAVEIIDCDDPRLCAVTIQTCEGPVLFVNVYMPTDTRDDNSFDEYVDTCMKISSVFATTNAVYMVIAGDFNCSDGSRFDDIYRRFLDDEQLASIDKLKLNSISTYVSDDRQRSSWIDHILCSQALLSHVGEVGVVYDYLCSDHLPLFACFHTLVQLTASNDGSVSAEKCNRLCDWSKASKNDINSYQSAMRSAIKLINVPSSVLSCNSACNDDTHHSLLSNYYNDIILCINKVSEDFIPSSSNRQCQYNVPGWSDYVSDKHDSARYAFREWVVNGKPRSGWLYMNMYKTRAVFKQALRYCRRHDEQMKADSLAKSVENTDCKKFWKDVNKVSCKKATSHVNKIGTCVGEREICEMWKDHFKSLYNSVPDGGARSMFQHNCVTVENVNCNVTVRDIVDAVSAQSKGKTAGPNGLFMESFIYACPELWIHLSLFFTACIKHCFLPQSFMDVIITPLIKNKGGNLTDINNYRAIALSNVDTKILERLLLSKTKESVSVGDKYQFGFKAGHSTSVCTGVVKKVINYYIDNGSHVFACFVDLTKAFDRVNYWKLFNQLISDGVNVYIVKLLAYWYVNQKVSVRWLSTRSESFRVGNGTKQGGVLSPYLFTRYLSQLITEICLCNAGCKIGTMPTNIFVYADDIVLLCPSWYAMQVLLTVLEKHCVLLDLCCNIMKTVCMVFNPKDKSKVVCNNFPCFSVGGKPLQFVTEFKYLGHVITCTLSDDKDLHREMRNMYTRTNTLLRRFGKCSKKVKVRLFRSYCVCMYGTALWNTYTVNCMKKLRSCYHRCIKSFLAMCIFRSRLKAFLFRHFSP